MESLSVIIICLLLAIMKVLINRHKLVVHLAQQVEQQQLHDNAADAVKKILKNLKTVTAIAT